MATDGPISGTPIKIIKNYTGNFSISIRTVKASTVHYCKWGQTYNLTDLEWSQQLLENSCEENLRNKVSEELMSLDYKFHGGPTYFYIMMKVILRTTDQATRALVQSIKNLKISKIQGENVLTATSLICRAIQRLEIINAVPKDITTILLLVYQTSSYPDFNNLFRLMEMHVKLNPTKAYKINKIIDIANGNYQELIDLGKWLGVRGYVDKYRQADNIGRKKNMVPEFAQRRDHLHGPTPRLVFFLIHNFSQSTRY